MRKLRWILLVLALLIAGYGLVRYAVRWRVPQGAMLHVELAGRYEEVAEPPLIARLLGRPTHSMTTLLATLEMAERDPRIASVVLQIRDLQIGWAKAEELRAAIRRLREAGRHPIALLDVEGLAANLEYYVASAAEEVDLDPASVAPLVGLGAEYLFLGGLWEKLGIELEVERVGRYKSAAETLAGREMSEAHREMAESLLDSIDAQFVGGIARSRGLKPEQVRAALAQAPSLPQELIEAGLADGEKDLATLRAERGDPPRVEADDYARIDPREVGFRPRARMALIYGTGPVVTGRGEVSRSGRPVLAGLRVAEALDRAARDADIDAIVFRVDSPGGSALASDIVWQAVHRARKAKPVVASLSDLAASGGYYVASAADVVVADRATLTGSIGVVVLRPVLAGLFDKLGIGYAALTRAPHADLLLSTRPLSPGSRARLRAQVEAIYQRFVRRVAQGRGLDEAKVDAVGQGRVWTGAQAAERGLIDGLGGLEEAVERAAERLGLPPDADVELVPYPPRKPLLEQIREALQQTAAWWPGERIGDLLGWGQVGSWLEELVAGGPLLIPEAWVRIR